MEQKNQTRREISRRQEMANEGVINAQFTQKGWFVKVKPAISIHKIIFDFVEKGKNGSGFAIYVDLDTFDNWVDDILDRTMLRVLASEKEANESYPKFYKFTTGENAEKSVGIANSTGNNGGYVINATTVVDKKKVYANVPVNYDWLKTTAKYYRRVTKASEVFEKIALDTYNSSNKYHKESPGERTAEPNSQQFNNSPSQSTTPPATSSIPTVEQNTSFWDDIKGKQEMKQETSRQAQQKTEQSTSVQQSSSLAQIVSLKLQVVKPIADMQNGGAALKAKTGDGKEFAVIFGPEHKNNEAEWKAFVDYAEVDAIIAIEGAIKENKIYVKTIA